MFYCLGDWDDLQIDLHISFHVGFEIQFAGILPVFSEFSGSCPVNFSLYRRKRRVVALVKVILKVSHPQTKRLMRRSNVKMSSAFGLLVGANVASAPYK